MASAAAASYSYFKPEFVHFYDQMVQEWYGGTKSADVQQYAGLLQSILSTHGQSSEQVVVDIGCGSGRATLAMLEHLTATRQALPTRLHVYGIDNSKPMIQAAQAKCANFIQQHPALGSSNNLHWTVGSFQRWSLPPQHKGQAVFILVAAAGLHHVTDTAELRLSLKNMADQLAPSGICVISYLPWAELYRQETSIVTEAPQGLAGPEVLCGAEANSMLLRSSSETNLTPEEFRVHGYKRVLVSRNFQTKEDGSTVLHEKFRLSKLVGNDETQVAWCIEESWDLRRLDRPELLQLAAGARLVPCESAHGFTGSEQKCGASFVVFKRAQQH